MPPHQQSDDTRDDGNDDGLGNDLEQELFGIPDDLRGVTTVWRKARQAVEARQHEHQQNSNSDNINRDSVSCCTCLMPFEVDDHITEWPHCHHRHHTTCMARILDPHGRRNTFPDIYRIHARRCPTRGEVMQAAMGLNIEGCVQAFGLDDEANTAHMRIARNINENPQVGELAHETPTHFVIRDYSDRTFSAGETPPPPEPDYLRPLCHNRLGPPPAFVQLPMTCMEWAPTANYNIKIISCICDGIYRLSVTAIPTRARKVTPCSGS